MSHHDCWDDETARDYDTPGTGMFAPEVLEPAVDRLAALAAGGRALEFAIGTGRVAVPLSRKGVSVTGIELSTAMVAQLRTKADEARIPVVIGDMATARAPGRFALVYLVYNTISNLLTQAEQVACFRNAARHLDPGGRFVIELWVPELRKLPPGQDAVVWQTEPGYVGLDTYDVLNQRVVSHHFRFDDDGQAALTRSSHRYVWPTELDLMGSWPASSLRRGRRTGSARRSLPSRVHTCPSIGCLADLGPSGIRAGRRGRERRLAMTITITAFERSPDGGKGLARDTRVRWALEEVGQPYAVRLVSFAAMKEPAHLALHPFGQIPTYQEGDLALFETGAIVLHIAERHAGLLPDDPNARARAITWMFAALNTVEPPIFDLEIVRLLESGKSWFEARLPLVEDRVRDRLVRLSARLGDADWLDGAFSAGDLMMVSVLLRLKSSGLLDGYPNLTAYVGRGEARPAYQRAFAAQLAVYTGKPPAG